tara:strand:+ start:875 stop:988 length:114 start_codon:yes stop_codon:yes gene_type:complete
MYVLGFLADLKGVFKIFAAYFALRKQDRDVVDGIINK